MSDENTAPTTDDATTCALEPAIVPRTIYPTGWSPEQIDGLAPGLAEPFEAMLQLVNDGGIRIRPHGATPQIEGGVLVDLLDSHGEPMEAKWGFCIVGPLAQHCGLYATVSSDEQSIEVRASSPDLTVDVAPLDEVVSEPARRRRRDA